jgi:prepilin peptidase CpaA
VQFWACLLLGLAASVEDLLRRRISNITVAAGLTAGLVLQLCGRGWLQGTLLWLGGCAAGFAVFLIFFLAGGMGGGDIKLMAALGGCVGAGQILRAALFTAVLGALEACGYLFAAWLRRRIAGRTPAHRRDEAIPYAPAICVGALLSFL